MWRPHIIKYYHMWTGRGSPSCCAVHIIEIGVLITKLCPTKVCGDEPKDDYVRSHIVGSCSALASGSEILPKAPQFSEKIMWRQNNTTTALVSRVDDFGASAMTAPHPNKCCFCQQTKDAPYLALTELRCMGFLLWKFCGKWPYYNGPTLY